MGERGSGHVEPQAADLVLDGRVFGVAALEEGPEQFHAVGEQGQRAAAVGEDPLDVRVAGQDSGEDQVADSAGGVEDELQHRPGPVQRDGLVPGRGGGVDEDDSTAALQLAPQRQVALIAEVDALGTGLQGDSVTAQLIQCVGEFDQRAVDVGQWQRGEGAEAVGTVAFEAGAELVDLAGQCPGSGVAAEVGAG